MVAAKRQKVVILGGFSHEGVYATVEASGYSLCKWRLDPNVKPRTWLKRATELDTLISKGELAACVLYLYTSLFLKASEAGYMEALFELIRVMNKVKSIIFVYQDDLDCKFAARIKNKTDDDDDLDWEFDYSFLYKNFNESMIAAEKNIDHMQSFVSSLYSHEVQIAPFLLRQDVTVRLDEFFNDVDEGIFLRLYVPQERNHTEQLGQLLSVMERYLRQVENKNFFIDSKKTENGTIYIFKIIDGDSKFSEFSSAIGRFDMFMRLCGDDPEEASRFLRLQGISGQESHEMVTKYTKDFKRIIMDVQHEFERRLLSLKHGYENDVLEGASGAIAVKNFNMSNLLGASPQSTVQVSR